MNASPPDHLWFTRERVLTITLALATFLGLYVCYLIVTPFIAPIAFAVALCVATQRPYDWLRRRVKSDAWAAVIAVILVSILIIGPLVLLGTYLANQIANNLDQLKSGQALAEIRDKIISRLPFQDTLLRLGGDLNLEEQFSKFGGAAASRATSILRGSIDLITQLVIMLFVLFFLYRDRKEARASLGQLVPLAADEANSLFGRVADTILATVNGSIIVGAVQAVLATIMYLSLGVPGAVLWGSLTFVAALIPVFGTVLIWGPVAIYLLLSGSFVKAAILVGWGAVAIGSIDNVLYPYLVGDRLRMHTVPTFFSLLGGIGLFGPSGLILGPVILAVTTALLDIWWERTRFGQAAEETIASSPEATESPQEVMSSGE